MAFKLRTANDHKLFAAAIAVRDMLKYGDIQPEDFDMSTFGSKTCSANGTTCGTRHCIGGWMDLELGGNGLNDPEENMENVSGPFRKALRNLFYPYEEQMEWSTPKDGLKALNNLIKKNSSRPWSDVKVKIPKER
jgi:hypothetical protein